MALSMHSEEILMSFGYDRNTMLGIYGRQRWRSAATRPPAQLPGRFPFFVLQHLRMAGYVVFQRDRGSRTRQDALLCQLCGLAGMHIFAACVCDSKVHTICSNPDGVAT